MSELLKAAQSPEEIFAFIEAFAKVTVRHIRRTLGSPVTEVAALESMLQANWDAPERLALSGLEPDQIDAAAREGRKYLHIDVALRPEAGAVRQLFLGLTGFSDKQQRVLFPLLRGRASAQEAAVAAEVARLNVWLDEVRADAFDPAAFDVTPISHPAITRVLG